MRAGRRLPLEEAVQSIEEVRRLVDSYGRMATKATMRRAIAQLQREEFHVVVVGGFSRGKSTVLNALAGLDILPTDINPSTRQIIYMHSAQSVSIHYSAGGAIKRRSFNRSTGVRPFLEKLSAEPQRYPEIHLFLPLPVPDKVVLIDTPGIQEETGSLTIKALPQFDAVLFVFDAAIQTKAEIEFMQKVAAEFPVFCVFNRVDALTHQHDQESIWGYFQQTILSQHPRGSIFCSEPLFISAYRALRAKQWQRYPDLWESLKKQEEEIAFLEQKFRTPADLLDHSGFPKFEAAFRTWLAAYPNWLALRAIRLARMALVQVQQDGREKILNRLRWVEEALSQAERSYNRARGALNDFLRVRAEFLQRDYEALHAYWGNRLRAQVETHLRAFENSTSDVLASNPATKLRRALLEHFQTWPSRCWDPIIEDISRAAERTWKSLAELDYTGYLNVEQVAPPAFEPRIPRRLLQPWPTALSSTSHTPLEEALAALPDGSDILLLGDLINWFQNLNQGPVFKVRQAFDQQMEMVRQEVLEFTAQLWEGWCRAALEVLRKEAGRDYLCRLQERHDNLREKFTTLTRKRQDLQDDLRKLGQRADALEQRLERVERKVQAWGFSARCMLYRRVAAFLAYPFQPLQERLGRWAWIVVLLIVAGIVSLALIGISLSHP